MQAFETMPTLAISADVFLLIVWLFVLTLVLTIAAFIADHVVPRIGQIWRRYRALRKLYKGR